MYKASHISILWCTPPLLPTENAPPSSIPWLNYPLCTSARERTHAGRPRRQWPAAFAEYTQRCRETRYIRSKRHHRCQQQHVTREGLGSPLLAIRSTSPRCRLPPTESRLAAPVITSTVFSAAQSYVPARSRLRGHAKHGFEPRTFEVRAVVILQLRLCKSCAQRYRKLEPFRPYAQRNGKLRTP